MHFSVVFISVQLQFGTKSSNHERDNIFLEDQLYFFTRPSVTITGATDFLDPC